MLNIKNSYFLLVLLNVSFLASMERTKKPASFNSFTKLNHHTSNSDEPSFCYFTTTCCIGYCAAIHTINGILYLFPNETAFSCALGATAFVGAFTIGNEVRHLYLDWQSKKKNS